MQRFEVADTGWAKKICTGNVAVTDDDVSVLNYRVKTSDVFQISYFFVYTQVAQVGEVLRRDR